MLASLSRSTDVTLLNNPNWFKSFPFNIASSQLTIPVPALSQTPRFCHSTFCPARRLIGCLGPAAACDSVCQPPPSAAGGRPGPRWVAVPSSGPSDTCV